jgi:signal transduction histidine kinase
MFDPEQYLKGLDEEQLRTLVLVPLLKRMGMRDVILYHGASSEKGKDISCYYDGPLEDRHYVAVVAKTGNIHGSVSKRGNAAEALIQAEQSLNEPYTDIYDLKQLRIDECWIMTSGEIKNTAVESIRGKLAKSNLDKLVRFIDRARLISLLSLHIPDFWHRERYVFQFANEMRAALVGARASASVLSRRWNTLRLDSRKRNLEGILADIQLALHLMETFTIEEQKELHVVSERFDCTDFVNRAFSTFSDIGERLTLTMGSLTRVPLMGDRHLLEHALVCLLDNAVRYSTGPIMVDATAHAKEVLIKVRDLGIGVPEGLHERIFDPWFRAENAVRLTGSRMGIGRTVARRVFREHGGNITLSNRHDPTEFLLSLPTVPHGSLDFGTPQKRSRGSKDKLARR